MKKIILSWFLMLPGIALAHGGGLGSDGCHLDKKTDNRHCHVKALETPQKKLSQPKNPTIKPSVNTLSRTELVQKIQKILVKQGYYNGPIDGRVSLATFNAIRTVQIDLNIPSDGKASKGLLDTLNLKRIR